ncbi:MAG: multiheme c-type cytochrome [Verrucomicrobiota bacterium]
MRRRRNYLTVWFGIITCLLPATARSYEFFEQPEKRPGYLGGLTCQTSMCHGGAAELSKQYMIWKNLDPHSKSYATLTTAWSKRMAESLEIKDPAKSSQCTVCHAPLAEVEPEWKTSAATVMEGVSCESCHGPASEYLLAHTRMDYSYDQKVASGLRDLHDLYNRANTCVACHQTLAPELKQAGHPELVFDFASLQEREPRHWEEAWTNEQIWIVGEAVALREMAYVLSQWEKSDEPHPINEAGKLATLREITSNRESFPQFPPEVHSGGIAWVQVMKAADRLAREFADIEWSKEDSLYLQKWMNQTAILADNPLPESK